MTLTTNTEHVVCSIETQAAHQELFHYTSPVAFEKSQAIIEFKMDGTIVTANENFLKGASVNEIARQLSVQFSIGAHGTDQHT